LPLACTRAPTMHCDTMQCRREHVPCRIAQRHEAQCEDPRRTMRDELGSAAGVRSNRRQASINVYAQGDDDSAREMWAGPGVDVGQSQRRCGKPLCAEGSRGCGLRLRSGTRVLKPICVPVSRVCATVWRSSLHVAVMSHAACCRAMRGRSVLCTSAERPSH
jgi:hypothetical protein